MKMRLTPLVVLLLIPQIFAWEENNLNDFMQSAFAKTNCSSFNISETLNVESVNDASYERLKLLMNSNVSRCENFVRGAYHYFELNDPKPTCARFYPTIHEWWTLWNWQFSDCGVTFGKSNADKLIEIYASDFWTKELEMEPVEIINEYYLPDTNEVIQPNKSQQKSDFFGGGGLSMDKNFIWTTVAYMPNILWFECLILAASFMLGRKIWKSAEWNQVVGQGTNSPGKAVLLLSPTKKLQYWFGIFVVLNFIFWIVWFVVL